MKKISKSTLGKSILYSLPVIIMSVACCVFAFVEPAVHNANFEKDNGLNGNRYNNL